MIVIGGSYYEKNYNTSPIIIGDKVFYICKTYPSKFEQEKMKKGATINIFGTKYGNFAVLICSDYIRWHDKLFDFLLDTHIDLDIIIVISHNPAIRRIQEIANLDCKRDPYPYILIVNCKEHGGTCVVKTEDIDLIKKKEMYVPKLIVPKNGIEYKLCEAYDEMMLITDLDIRKKAVTKPRDIQDKWKLTNLSCYKWMESNWNKLTE